MTHKTMPERALVNEYGIISCAGPGEGGAFAICIAQAPLVSGTKTAMIPVSRPELIRWLKEVTKMVEESIQ